MLDTVRELERQGFEVTYPGRAGNGLVSMDVLKAAIRPDTILASGHVNNEIGVIRDILPLAPPLPRKGVSSIVDAAQATGRVEIDMNVPPIDLMSLTAHKTHGPKGIGLFKAPQARVRLKRRCMAAATSAACAAAPCPRTRSWVWAKPSSMPRKKMLRAMPRPRALQ